MAYKGWYGIIINFYLMRVCWLARLWRQCYFFFISLFSPHAFYLPPWLMPLPRELCLSWMQKKIISTFSVKNRALDDWFTLSLRDLTFVFYFEHLESGSHKFIMETCKGYFYGFYLNYGIFNNKQTFIISFLFGCMFSAMVHPFLQIIIILY